MTTREQARFWEHPGLPGVDLLRARYVRHTFSWHVHDEYVVAAVTSGVEAMGLPSGSERAGAGSVVLINPGAPHTAYAGAEEGWSYRVLYPSPAVVSAVAAEVSALRGTPAFTRTVLEDPAAVRLITDVHRAAEQDNTLAADTLLRLVLARPPARRGGPAARSGAAPDAGPRRRRPRPRPARRPDDGVPRTRRARRGDGQPAVRTPARLQTGLRAAPARLAHR